LKKKSGKGWWEFSGGSRLVGIKIFIKINKLRNTKNVKILNCI